MVGETAREVAKRYAHLSCVKLLETDFNGKFQKLFEFIYFSVITFDTLKIESEDEAGYEKSDMNAHTEAKDPIMLSTQQKKEAKARARKRLEDIDKQLTIARSNYLQLGGRLEDVINNEMRNEQLTIK
jgi:ankyrin repeat domain-containing protein 42